jgi:hypothetical protein
MEWVRRLIDGWRTSGQGRVRRVIVLGFAGLEPALVDHYLEQGLLHYFALLSDIGTRASWADSRPHDAARLAGAIGKLGVQAVALPSPHLSSPADLKTICEADRLQQERLIAVLTRSRPGIIACDFDMPAQLARLLGPDPDDSERLVIRDVYARMDEIVGKAFSFVDDRTVLLAAIASPNLARSDETSTTPGLIFASCAPDAIGTSEIALRATVLRLLGVAPRDA